MRPSDVGECAMRADGYTMLIAKEAIYCFAVPRGYTRPGGKREGSGGKEKPP
jgi:hypothetical protein